MMWHSHTLTAAIICIQPQSSASEAISSLICSRLLYCRICKLLSCFCQSALCQSCTIRSGTSVTKLSSILIQYKLLCSIFWSATDLFIATDCSDMPRLFLICISPFWYATGPDYVLPFCSAPAAPAVFSAILPTEPLATTATGPFCGWTSAYSCSAFFFWSRWHFMLGAPVLHLFCVMFMLLSVFPALIFCDHHPCFISG